MFAVSNRTTNTIWILGIVAMVAWASDSLFASDVTFDVNPLVPAQHWSDETLKPAMPQSRFVSIRLDVTACVRAGSSIALQELMVRVDSRDAMVQVADYWPRTELYSPIVDNILVQNTEHQNRDASIQGVAGYPGVGWANGQTSFHDENHVEERFARKPARQLLAAAGTLDRRSAVYFKLHQSPQESLEGSRSFGIILEVPVSWRAGLLTVSMEAYGQNHAKGSLVKLAECRFMVATYQEADNGAAQLAYRYVVQEQRLRERAIMAESEINRRKYPTPVHKLGAALDVYEPEIPNAWLDQVIFGWTNTYPTGAINRLPVDVRVGILDYLDAKRFIERVPPPVASNLATQTQLANHNVR